METGNNTTIRSFIKNNGIYQCNLYLENAKVFSIPLREDGYINATQLCKIAGKYLYKWKNLKETNVLITQLSILYKLKTEDLIQVYKGNSKKFEQGTYIHPDLGVQLAMWCNPVFSVQVSRWIRELMITGEVKLGQEKTDEQLQEELQKKLDEANEQINELQNHIEWQDKRYKQLENNHQYYRRVKEQYKLRRGKCVYLVDASQNGISKIKVGYSEDITERVSHFRTINPESKLVFAVYTKYNQIIEKAIKERYEDNRPYGRELITNIPLDTLKNQILRMTESFMDDFQIATDEELENFNKNIIDEKKMVQINEEMKAQEETDKTTKHCCGQWHDNDKDRQQPLSNFYKNKSNPDGHARLCKNCYARSQNRQGYNEKLRKDKPLPDFNPSTHKWCNRCSSVKSLDDFYNSKETKDGKSANCKKCKQEQKQKNKTKNNEQPNSETVN